MTGLITKINYRALGLLTLALLVLVRGLVTPGYMPSSWADGSPVTLCPQGLDASWFASISSTTGEMPGAHAHHHHGHHQAHSTAVNDHATNQTDRSPPGGEADHPLDRCALGSALNLLALPATEIEFNGVGNRDALIDKPPVRPAATSIRAFQARAPPA